MNVFLNPGHDLVYDPGAVNERLGLKECDIAANVADLTKGYLENAGLNVRQMQSDNLAGEAWRPDRQESVCGAANRWPADLFVSIHCNAFNGRACGTETFVFDYGGRSHALATAVQRQIVESLGTTDRGVKANPSLIVLNSTEMPAVLVELAFIDNDLDAWLLANCQEEFARALARGVTDYLGGVNV